MQSVRHVLRLGVPALQFLMETSRALWYVGTKVKNLISQYATIYSGNGATLTGSSLNERSVPAEAYLLVDKLDIYDGDWGRIYVIKNRNMSNTTAFAAYGTQADAQTPVPTVNVAVTPAASILGFEPRYAALGAFQGFEHFPLGKMGSMSNGYVEAILGTVCRNPRAFACGVNCAA